MKSALRIPARARGIGILPITLLLALLLPVARAAEPTATASLSRNVTTVGAPVVLTITVSGARGADAPRSINVEGLIIQYAGQSTSVQMRNFDISAEVTHSYRIVPRTTGEFTIPAQNIIVGNQRLRTNPVTLTARGRSSGSAQTVPPPAPGVTQFEPDSGELSLDDLANADLIVPKSTVYVGEAVPIELRFYFDATTDFRANQGPQLPAEGFTLEPFPEPRQEDTTRQNRRMSQVTFQSVITPVKTGELDLGPASMEVTASIRRARPNLPHLADQFFNDPFFNRSYSPFTSQEELTIQTGSEKLTVKPLPRDGQPEEFSGSVGQFAMEGSAGARKVAIGDPVTYRIMIRGRGNFARMDAPILETGSGWRAYPPSDKFVKDDTLGVSGTKTFEYQVVPTDNVESLPPVSFSYFDPNREKYVTLNSEPIPIEVEGQPIAAASPALQAAPAVAPSPEATDQTSEPADILGLATEGGPWDRSFVPLYQRPEFYYAQAIPALALLGLIALGSYRRWSSDSAARRDDVLRAQRSRSLAELQKAGLARAEFYSLAVRTLQAETARRTGAVPETVHAAEVLACASLDEGTIAGLRRIFSAYDESAYSGADQATPDQGERNEVVQTVKSFIQSHA